MVEPIFLNVPQAQPYQPISPAIQSLGNTALGVLELYQKQQADLLEKERQRLLLIQKENDLKNVISNPTSLNILKYKALHPEDAAKLEPSFARIADEAKTSEFNELIGPYFAAQTGDTETFKQGLDRRASALEESKDQSNIERAKVLRNISALADKNLANAKLELGARLAYLRPEQFKSVTEYMTTGRTAEERDQQVLAKAQFDAKKAAVEAKFAESQAVADLDFKKAQIENYAVMQDIAKQNADIARQRLDIDRESNNIKRDMMQADLDAKLAQRDQTLRERKAEMDNSLLKMQTAKDVALKIIKTPRSVRENVHGPGKEALRQKYPTATGVFIGQAEQDYINLTDQFRGGVFLSGIEGMKGSGSITETEGKKAADSLTAASLSGSVEAMDEAIMNYLQLVNRGQKIAKDKFGADVPAPAPAPAPAGGEPVIDLDF